MADISAQSVQLLRERTGLGLMQCKKALTETSGDLEKAIEQLRKQGAAVAAKRVDKEAKEGVVSVGSNAQGAAIVEINCETDFVAASDDFKGFIAKVLNIVLEKQPDSLETLTGLALDGGTVKEVNEAVMAKVGEKISLRRFAFVPVGVGEIAQSYSHMNGKIGVIVKLGFTGQLNERDRLESLAKDLCMQVAAASPIAIEAKDVPASLIEKEREIYREVTLKEGKTGDVVDKIVEGKVNKFFKENCLVNQVFVKDSKQTVEKLLASTAKELGLESIKVLSFHRMQLGQ